MKIKAVYAPRSVGGICLSLGGVTESPRKIFRGDSDTPNDVKFFLYAYDLDADAAWRGPITFEIQQDGVVVSAFDRVEPDSEGVYVTRETLPSSGNYDVVFHFAEDGQPVTLVLPIYADLAADRIDWGLLGGVGAGVGVIFVLALSGRRRRHARRAPAAS